MIRVKSPAPITLAGIVFLAAANISLEIVATRYFSIAQSHHLAFFVVSTAFLGFGAGGCFLFLKTGRGVRVSASVLCLSSLFFALAIFICVPLLNAFPFDFMELLWARGRLSHLLLIHLFLALPFFFSGWTMARAITLFSSVISRVYASDLMGAAIGAFFPSLLFLPRGDKGAFLLIGIMALLAALLFSISFEKKFVIPSLLGLLAAVGLLLYPPSCFEFRLSPYKPLSQALQPSGARLLLTRWNVISRVDIVSSPSLRSAPGLSLAWTGPLPSQLGLFIDGGQPSALTSFATLQDPELSFVDYLPSSLPFLLTENPRVLIIEPRGGLEILSSLYYSARKIKIIEGNPLIPSLLRTELADKTGHFLSNPRIEIVSAFPRSALKRETGPYDLIIFSLPDIFAASGTGLASLREDHLFTRESFIQALQLLSPNGFFAATTVLLPPAREELRMVATLVEALEAIHSWAQESMLILLSWGTITMVAKKSPFTPAEIDRVSEWAEERLFNLAYFPGRIFASGSHPEMVEAFPSFLIPELLDPKRREALYRNYLFAIRPATDNRPFFHHTIKLSRLRETFFALGKKIVPLLEGGGLYPLLLAQVALVATVFLFFPLLLLKKRLKLTLFHPAYKFALPYFGFIAAGFMMTEIVLIQKGILFLGHPVYAFSLVLFSLLLSSGIGSFLSNRLAAKITLFKGWFILICSALIFLDSLILPPLFEFFMAKPLGLRMATLFLLILPTGFFLGFPFPEGIARLRRMAPEVIPLAWSANAFSSVGSSILAAILALWGGYRLLFFLASLFYASSFLFFCLPYHRDKANP